MDVHDRNLFNNPKNSDMIVKYSGKTVHAHTAILCSRLKWFDDACGSDSKFSEKINKCVELHEDDPDSVTAMLKFLYSYPYDSLLEPRSRKLEQHLNIAQIADKYGLSELRKHAEDGAILCVRNIGRLGHMVSVMEVFRNVPQFYTVAPKLETAVKKIRDENIVKLIGDESFLDLIHDDNVLYKDTWKRVSAILNSSASTPNKRARVEE